MDTELRALIDRSKFHQGAVREVAAWLPATDDDLAVLLAETIAAGDVLGFLLVVTAALDAGRRVDAQCLVGGTALVNDPMRIGNLAWKMEGDVPGALMAALKHRVLPHETCAGVLFIVAAWCVERRAGELPANFIAEARHHARIKQLNINALGYLASVAARVKDEGLLSVLTGNFPDVFTEKLAPLAENVAKANLDLFALPAMDFVPAEPPKAVAFGRTMRRAVEKLGRNDPCHCGSQKKYKRCCFEKDQERLQLSSGVAGLTHAELRAEPETGLTEPRLKALSATDLARIDPRKVPENLRRTYIMQVTGFKLLERAVEFFEVLEWNDEIAEAWNFTLFFVMREQRKDIAERMVAVADRHDPFCDIRSGVRLLLARDEPAEESRVLAATAMDILRETDPDKLINLGYGILCSRHAELGILICRSLIATLPPAKGTFLLEQILEIRDKLNLPPDDPFSDVLEKRLAEATHDEGSDAAALRAARKRLDAKAAEVRQLHEEIERQRRALERREKTPPTGEPPVPVTPSDEAGRRDLRLKLTELKGELHARSAERATLRRDLEKAREDLEALRQHQPAPTPAGDSTGDDEDAHYLPEQAGGNQPLRLAEFPHKFRETLEDLPRQAARAALALIGRLAGGEPAAFAGVVQLRACPGILRQRIGSEHRLLFRLLPDRVQVVDLINRRDLDRTIKRLRAAG